MTTAGLVSGCKLKCHQSLYEALDLAEKTAFNNYLAREVYTLRPEEEFSSLGYFPESSTTDVGYATPLPEISSTSTSEQLSASLIEEVSKCVSNGISDTYIIENVLHCKGRKYQEGKNKLTEIKLLISGKN